MGCAKKGLIVNLIMLEMQNDNVQVTYSIYFNVIMWFLKKALWLKNVNILFNSIPQFEMFQYMKNYSVIKY